LKRISDISTAEDIALEGEREVLRDRRWRRWRSMLGVAGYWLVAILWGLNFPPPWVLVERLFGLL
jgi:hypothetical protein